MGQYWKLVNLTRKEWVNPHTVGAGLKLREQIGTHPGTGAAMLILCAAMGPKGAAEARGGGDLDPGDRDRRQPLAVEADKARALLDDAPETYEDIAKRTIGRWAGDRVCLVGDYAEDHDMPDYPSFGSVYKALSEDPSWVDVSADVARVIEHECDITFTGEEDGWRDWTDNRKAPSQGRG